ncbi:MAG: SH3 domain-containing protein [Anaerolineae bacterium]
MRRLLPVITIFALAFVLATGFTAAPAEAQSATWVGQYYNNPYLLDPPAYTRTDSAIAFNWGLGGPGNGVGVDNFSIRWATDVYLTPGTYRFYAQADDNVRVTFNYNTTVIDTFASNIVGQLQSGDVSVVGAGTYHIQVDYRELSETAYVYVSFANLATDPNPPNFPVNPSVGNGQWIAYYYPNTTLSGDPAGILTLSTPNFNTGGAAPLPSMPATNWSARFTSVQTLAPGGYQATFSVDDGVRFYVNGALLLDQFGGATGQTQSVAFNVPTAQTNLQIDYVQFGGNAYLQYNLVPVSVVSPTQSPVTGGPYATARVTAGKLNVRSAPNSSAPVVTQVTFGQQFPVYGKSSDSRWYLIDVNGTQGWASASYLRVDRPANVPVVNANAQVPATPPPANGQPIATATPYAVNVRSAPSTSASKLATMPVGATATVIGRTADNTWWQVNYNGIVGWASAEYAVIQQNVNINNIPVTG